MSMDTFRQHGPPGSRAVGPWAVGPWLARRCSHDSLRNILSLPLPGAVAQEMEAMAFEEVETASDLESVLFLAAKLSS